MDFWFEFLNIQMNEKTITYHGFKWKNLNIYQILTLFFLVVRCPLWLVGLWLHPIEGICHVQLEKKTNWCEGSKCTWCHGLLPHIHLWLLLQIGVGKNVSQKCCKIGGIKCSLWIDVTIPLRQWDKLYMRAWSWLKGELPQGHVQFDMKCDLVRYGNKVETIVKIYI